jgi:uncharacterized protein YqjF (DUF2071 family)
MKEPTNGLSAGEPDETGLAVLVACHQRGPLSAAELARFVSARGQPLENGLASLAARGMLAADGNRWAVTQLGRDWLDHVLEGIESQLTPDDPHYVARYRRPEPSLPFQANTIWAEAVCVNIRVRPENLRMLVPPPFELDVYKGWGFVSLTASRLKEFGVGVLPKALRMNFYQATYRAHVTFTDFRGRRLRGCYFVRSETNSHLMSLTANLLPEFKAHHCGTYPMLMVRHGDRFIFTADTGSDPAGKVVLVLDTSSSRDCLPPGSCFASLEAAYEYIVDFYDAFSRDPDTGDVFILRIDRGPWQVRIPELIDHYLGYIRDGPFPLGAAELDSVFYFQNTPYRWLPLLKERVRQDARGQAAGG